MNQWVMSEDAQKGTEDVDCQPQECELLLAERRRPLVALWHIIIRAEL